MQEVFTSTNILIIALIVIVWSYGEKTITRLNRIEKLSIMTEEEKRKDKYEREHI